MIHHSVNPFELNENFIKAIGKDCMLITAAKPDGSINAMTAAWGGIGFIWQQPVAFCFIRPQRYTKDFVEASSTFSLSFFDPAYLSAVNFMGTVSGRDDTEKIAHSGLTLAFKETPVEQEIPPGGKRMEQTPYFSEARLVVFCERLYQQDLLRECFVDKNLPAKWYGQAGDENDLHTMYIAAIKDILSHK